MSRDAIAACNQYVYANGNPVRFGDPLGLQPKPPSTGEQIQNSLPPLSIGDQLQAYVGVAAVIASLYGTVKYLKAGNPGALITGGVLTVLDTLIGGKSIRPTSEQVSRFLSTAGGQDLVSYIGRYGYEEAFKLGLVPSVHELRARGFSDKDMSDILIPEWLIRRVPQNCGGTI